MTIPSLVFDPVAVHGLAATLAILLMFGAWQKLRDPLVFSAAVENYGLLSASWVPVLAFCLPIMEAAAGTMLLLPKTAMLGGATALLVLSLATSAVGWSSTDASLSPNSWSMPCGRNTALPLRGSHRR